MITVDKELQLQDGATTVNQTYFGIASDSKPTEGIGNGSRYIEMDTGKGYFFDVENAEWLEFTGGGSGGSGLPSVTAADNGKVLSVVNGAWAADARGKVVFDGSGINKSFNDLLAMFNQGIIPWFIDEFEDDGEHLYHFVTCSYAGVIEGDYFAFFSSLNAGNQLYTMGFINSDPTLPMLFD